MEAKLRRISDAKQDGSKIAIALHSGELNQESKNAGNLLSCFPGFLIKFEQRRLGSPRAAQARCLCSAFDSPDQLCRGYALATVLSTLPIWIKRSRPGLTIGVDI
jgi:hypothetical protein